MEVMSIHGYSTNSSITFIIFPRALAQFNQIVNNIRNKQIFKKPEIYLITLLQ